MASKIFSRKGNCNEKISMPFKTSLISFFSICDSYSCNWEVFENPNVFSYQENANLFFLFHVEISAQGLG